MGDILTVGDLIAELSKHPADAQLRVTNEDDGEYRSEVYCAGYVFDWSDEKAISIVLADRVAANAGRKPDNEVAES
jgi:hypothetical protein